MSNDQSNDQLDLEDDEDIFSDDYKSRRNRMFDSIEEIEQSLIKNRKERWQKNTRKKTPEKPEAKVKAKIRKHLEKVYRAKVLRTNAGSIIDQQGNTIYLGETGQSDLQAIIPISIDGFTFGMFMAIETKAGNNTATDSQKKYLKQVVDRGGIGVIAWSTEDIDKAILEKMIEIQLRFESRRSSI